MYVNIHAICSIILLEKSYMVIPLICVCLQTVFTIIFTSNLLKHYLVSLMILTWCFIIFSLLSLLSTEITLSITSKIEMLITTTFSVFFILY